MTAAVALHMQADRPLQELAPRYRDPKSDIPATQFNMTWVEAAGLVKRTVIPSSPPTVEYRLTPRGRTLGPIIAAMRAYAREPVG